MKYLYVLINIFGLFFLTACSKSSSPSPAPGGGTGGTDTTRHDTTVVVVKIVTKVMEATDNNIGFDTVGGFLAIKRLQLGNIYGGVASLNNTGTKNLTILLRNSGTITTYFFGPTPCIKFSNSLKKDPSAINTATLAADTLATMIEIDGLTVAANGCDRLLIPLCQTIADNSGTLGNTNQYPLSVFSEARVKAAFPSKLSAVTINIAPKF